MSRAYRVVDVPRDGACLWHALVVGWCSYCDLACQDAFTAAAVLRELSVRHLFVRAQTDHALLRVCMGLESGIDNTEPLRLNHNRCILGKRLRLVIASGIDVESGETPDAYMHRIREHGTFCGESEILAAADLLRCRIVCYWQGDGKRQRSVYGRSNWPRIRILYLPSELHYSALVPAATDLGGECADTTQTRPAKESGTGGHPCTSS